jgi:uncharacterized protein GlcG (DUF336 family)
MQYAIPNNKTNTAVNNRGKIALIQRNYHSGVISYEQAKEQAEPILVSINNRAKELAKKYNQRPKIITFAEVIR